MTVSASIPGSGPIWWSKNKVIVEIESVEVLLPVHKKQLLTYLRLADKRLGLLINFQVALIKLKTASRESPTDWKTMITAKSPSRKEA